MFELYIIPIILIALLFIWFVYSRQLRNLVRPAKIFAECSGAPNYVVGSTSGSPLSDLGSHCGFKAVSERKPAACSALFATVASFGAGRLYDFAACLYSDNGRVYFKAPHSRKVRFSPYCIEEQARDGNFILNSRLFFLQSNLAVFETEWEVSGEGDNGPLKVKPACFLLPTLGRDLENPYPHFNGFTFFKQRGSGLQLSCYHRLPGLKMYAYFMPSSGAYAGRKEMQAEWMNLKPGQKLHWSVVISFSADGDERVVKRAERAHRNLERLKASSKQRWSRFEERLPVPYEADKEASRATLKLAAWALQNSLYYPRGKMKNWGSVPAKVYFPFIWGWDTPQHVLGLSEWNPKKAGDVLLTQLAGNYFAPRKARFKLKIKGITFLSGTQSNLIPSKLDDQLRGVLDFYSQPPLQSWAAVRVYERFRDAGARQQFLDRVLPPLRENLAWWEESRKLKNGFFSYINGLESGLDDSPRFYPPSFLPSFIIGLVPRFFSAVDLNCWIFQSYVNVAYLCRKAGLEEDAAGYLQRGLDLRERIDRDLWNPRHEAWLDRRNGKFIEVFTPSVWWPAFVGAASSLDKVRAVVEKYLLNPEKFWGAHGIPSVAFDDKSYNSRKDGYYWRGQIWMINNYTALEVLYRFGYVAEARELHKRIIRTVHASRGLYETYDGKTGEIGWSSRGPGDPAVMQFGMSSAWATQIVFCRYQHFRYLFADTKELKGHIQWATTFDHMPRLSPPSVEESAQDAVLNVDVSGEHAYDVPKIILKSNDGRPLLDSTLLSLRFENPAGCLDQNSTVHFAWRGQCYQARLNTNYQLRPYAPSGKLSSA